MTSSRSEGAGRGIRRGRGWAGNLLALAGIAGLLVGVVALASQGAPKEPRVVVLGFDGLDYGMTERFISEGDLPHFRALAERGGFLPLQTSLPPQSPVAWSSIITGMNPGGTGIFDFVARDPKTYLPYLSTTMTHQVEKSFCLGDWFIPLAGGDVELLRKGKAFWEVLSDAGVPCTVMRMPANFPPVECEARTLSDMGTPDILGTYGTFLTYTTDIVKDRDVGGGRINEVDEINYVIEAALPGPGNPCNGSDFEVPFTVYVDPKNPVAKISIGDEDVILKEGEWSDWVTVSYKLMPWQSISGICRFLLRSVRPEFELYVTPINMDPRAPALPISTPADFSKQLADAIGLYYTQGMPEDTQALRNERLTDDEFLQQVGFVMDERWKMFRHELDDYKKGMLFFYFGSTDLLQHMFWRSMDPQHPAYTPALGAAHGDVIRNIYREADRALGYAMEKLGDDVTVLVVSDHGFNPFYRQFNLNTWLRQEGYLHFKDESKSSQGEFFQGVDWSRTRAYAMGFNGLFLNLRGREGKGIVNPGSEADALIQEIKDKLERVVDPENGKQVITRAYLASEEYSGSEMANAPDIIPGYARGYRASDETVLGETPAELISDNTDEWSGDHLIDPRWVPGVVFCNRPIASQNPALTDVAPTLLSIYGIQPLPEMVGKPMLNVTLAARGD